MTFAVFGQTARFEFLNFDDNMISENPKLAAGLTPGAVAWAFKANLGQYEPSVEYWQPLTVLTRLADVQFFGLDAGRHHLTNVFIHAIAGLVLFGTMRALLRSTWRSAVIAALFLIHPLHVEPVAWLAARKDLLNGLFYFATIWAYAWYAARPNWRRYLLVCVSFLAANMAKPMAVSLPLVLLLLDYWPLRRFESTFTWSRFVRLVGEKLPLFVITAVISFLAVLVQQRHGAMGDTAMFPIAVRLGNAAISVCIYLGQTCVPVGLAIFYPHPGAALDWTMAAAATLCCVAITLLCVLQAKARPWLLIGWGWFIAVLLPVAGIVQIGEMARADRYTYVALVGIFLLLVQQVGPSIEVWAAQRQLSPAAKGALVFAMCTVVGANAFAAWKQTSTWRNSITVFSRALEVTEDNYVAHANLGNALFDAGRKEEGLKHYHEALRLHEPALNHHRAAGAEAEARGDLRRAIFHYGKVITVLPSDLDVRQRLGGVLYRNRDYGKALAQFNEVLRHDPAAVPPRIGIARILIAQSRIADARTLLTALLQKDEDNREAKELLEQLPQ